MPVKPDYLPNGYVSIDWRRPHQNSASLHIIRGKVSPSIEDQSWAFHVNWLPRLYSHGVQMFSSIWISRKTSRKCLWTMRTETRHPILLIILLPILDAEGNLLSLPIDTHIALGQDCWSLEHSAFEMARDDNIINNYRPGVDWYDYHFGLRW